jgi:hypothetical protein
MNKLHLVTDADRIRLFANALSPERNHQPVLRIFLPGSGITWLISECDPDQPDSLFALCDLACGHPELGFVSLDEIMQVRSRLGLPVERDQHFIATKSISEYAREARIKGRIVA